MFAKVNPFETKLQLWKVHFQNNDTVHFPTLQEQKHSTTAEHPRKCAKISEAFIERLHDIKCKQTELDIFATHFHITADTVPSNFQHKIIELHTDDTLKGMYFNTPLVNLYPCLVNADDFPILRKLSLKYVPLFGSTYCCEQFLSKLNLTKSLLCSNPTDQNIEVELQIAKFSTSADISHLTRKKNFQPSHKKFLCSFNIYVIFSNIL